VRGACAGPRIAREARMGLPQIWWNKRRVDKGSVAAVDSRAQHGQVELFQGHPDSTDTGRWAKPHKA